MSTIKERIALFNSNKSTENSAPAPRPASSGPKKVWKKPEPKPIVVAAKTAVKTSEKPKITKTQTAAAASAAAATQTRSSSRSSVTTTSEKTVFEQNEVIKGTVNDGRSRGISHAARKGLQGKSLKERMAAFQTQKPESSPVVVSGKKKASFVAVTPNKVSVPDETKNVAAVKHVAASTVQLKRFDSSGSAASSTASPIFSPIQSAQARRSVLPDRKSESPAKKTTKRAGSVRALAVDLNLSDIVDNRGSAPPVASATVDEDEDTHTPLVSAKPARVVVEKRPSVQFQAPRKDSLSHASMSRPRMSKRRPPSLRKSDMDLYLSGKATDDEIL